MQHNARFDRAEPDVGAILVISGSRLTVGDTLHIDGVKRARITAFGLGRLVVDVSGVVFELRPWHKGDGDAPAIDGPASTWTISGMPNHTRSTI